MKSKKNALLWLLILFSFLHFFHDTVKFAVENQFIDFGHYFFYTTLVAQGGNPLDRSDVERLRQKVDYRFSTAPAHYPPFFYVYMRPLTWVPFKTAKILWFMLMAALLLVSPVLLIGPRQFRFRVPESWLPHVLLLWAQPVYEDLGIGQSNIWLFFIIVLACCMIERRKPFWGGILFALAFMTKLHYGLFGLYYLWRRDWPVFRGFLAGCVVFLLIGLGATSLQQHRDLLAFVTNPPAGFIEIPTNISIAGALARSMGYAVFGKLTAATLLSYLSIAAVLAPLMMLGRHRRLSPLFDVSMVLLLVPLLSPLVEEAHLIALFVTFYVLDKEGSVWQSRKRTAMFVLAYLIIATRFSLVSFSWFYLGPQSILLSLKIVGVVLLYVLSLGVWRDATENVAATSALRV